MDSSSYRKRLALLVALGVLVRIALVFMYPMSTLEEMRGKLGDEYGYFTFAHNMVENHEYTGTNGKKAYQPPGYATYLAANLLVYGDSRPPIQVTQNLLFIGSVLLLALVARRSFGDRVSLWTAGLLFLNPVWFIVPQEAASENVFMPLVAASLVLVLGIIRAPRAGPAIAAGLLFGLSALTREFGIVYCGIAAVILWLALRRTQPGWSAARLPALMVLCMAAVILPWSIRNYVIFRQIVPITTNSKMQIYIGNNPKANGEFMWELPGDGKKLWNTYAANGVNELKVSNEMGREGIKYVLENPGHCLSLWPRKFILFWQPHTLGELGMDADSFYRIYRSSWWALSIPLGLAGLWLIRKSPVGLFIISVAVVSTFVHLLTYVRIEYRQPLDFLFAIPISVAIIQLLDRRAGRPTVHLSSPESVEAVT